MFIKNGNVTLSFYKSKSPISSSFRAYEGSLSLKSVVLTDGRVGESRKIITDLMRLVNEKSSDACFFSVSSYRIADVILPVISRQI